MTKNSQLVVGVDFGTLSRRAVIFRVSDGAELCFAVYDYPRAVIDRTLPTRDATRLPPSWALVTGDYVGVLQHAVPGAFTSASVDPDDVIGIATDFTASTPLPVTAEGTPLSALPDFVNNPHAYVKLWKHYAAQGQADRINELARAREGDWLSRYGGLISYTWEFAAALQLLEEALEVYAATRYWVEAADRIVWQLCGLSVYNACTAGYKRIFQDGAYPSPECLAVLNPDFTGFVTTKLERPIGQFGSPAGVLTEQAAAWTGLPAGIAVAVGNVDAHVTVPAGNAIAPGQMVASMGTSTCHLMNGAELKTLPVMCGVVDGGITKGLRGYGAGQSGVGDIFGWFVDSSVSADCQQAAADTGQSMHGHLIGPAARPEIGQHGLLVLDWHNGNRPVLVDRELSGLIVGLTVTTRAEDIYRALIEATAFGARTIVEAFKISGDPVNELVISGGLTKNAMLMHIYTDVLRLPVSVIGSAQGAALGSVIHAAIAAGAYPDVYAAAAVVGQVNRNVYFPIAVNADAYDALFAEYTALHDYFGGGGNRVLKAIQRAAQARAAQR